MYAQSGSVSDANARLPKMTAIENAIPSTIPVSTVFIGKAPRYIRHISLRRACQKCAVGAVSSVIGAICRAYTQGALFYAKVKSARSNVSCPVACRAHICYFLASRYCLRSLPGLAVLAVLRMDQIVLYKDFRIRAYEDWSGQWLAEAKRPLTANSEYLATPSGHPTPEAAIDLVKQLIDSESKQDSPQTKPSNEDNSGSAMLDALRAEFPAHIFVPARRSP